MIWALAIAAAHAGPLADELVSHVVDACGAESAEVVHLGIDPGRLPEHDALSWSGDPCGTHPKVIVSALQDGEVVHRSTFWPKLAVQPSADRGSDVDIKLVQGPLVLTAPGRLMADASAGGVVKVVNEATGTVVVGVYVGDDTVEIR